MRNVLIVLVTTLALASCGKKQPTAGAGGPPGLVGNPGAACSALQVAPSLDAPYGGVLVTCEASQVFVSNGAPGANGLNGSNGLDGVNGQDGGSCSVQQVLTSFDLPNGGAIITCGSDAVLIANGAPGATGADGQPGPAGPISQYGIDAIIDPCGDAPGVFDEVIIKLASGQLVASISDKVNGENTRLSLIPAGSYQTTDGSNCNFSVSASGLVSW